MFVFLLVLAVIAFIVFRLCIVIVRDRHVVLVERFGRYTRTLSPGVHFLVPFVERPRTVDWSRVVQTDIRNPKKTESEVYRSAMIPVRQELIFDIPPVSVVLRDRLMVSIDSVLHYRIVDPLRAVYDVQDLWAAITTILVTSLRNTFSSLRLDDAIDQREVIQRRVVADFAEPASRYGITVTLFEVQGIAPPAQIVKEEEKLVAAQRSAEADLVRTDAERRCRVAAQNADVEVQRLKADGDAAVTVAAAGAQQRVRQLEADGEANYLRTLMQAGVSESFILERERVRLLAGALQSARHSLLIAPSAAAQAFGATALGMRRVGSGSAGEFDDWGVVEPAAAAAASDKK
jgi:regulator of protease activity HflC (stomatin/prohibitin superfamily)